ncbi:NusG domain II-containing protein, partial [Enterococcus faecalis]
DGDRVRIKEADCDDQICVRRGWATKNGETIVCLPHKLVIEVRSTDGGDEDSLIY